MMSIYVPKFKSSIFKPLGRQKNTALNLFDLNLYTPYNSAIAATQNNPAALKNDFRNQHSTTQCNLPSKLWHFYVLKMLVILKEQYFKAAFHTFCLSIAIDV